MNPVTLPPELAEALYGYLMGRPMGEVERLVMGLRSAVASASNPEGQEAKK